MATLLTTLPRTVPLTVRIALYFGGVVNQIGYGLFTFGMIFFWVFAANADLMSWYYFRGNLETATGTVTAVRKTSFTVNDSPVQAVEYAYAHNDRRYAGTSYTSDNPPAAGAAVKVEWPPGNPAYSRIRGMRTKLVDAWVAFVVIFPGAGLGMVIWGLLRGHKAVGLLANGAITGGKLVAQQATNTRVNNQVVHALTFEFQSEDGQKHQTVVKTHRVSELTDEAREMLLYDPANPRRAILFDALPMKIELNEEGSFYGRPQALLCLLLPMLAIGGNLVYLLMRD